MSNIPISRNNEKSKLRKIGSTKPICLEMKSRGNKNTRSKKKNRKKKRSACLNVRKEIKGRSFIKPEVSNLSITGLVRHQFVKFMFVGVINSLFGYSCFALFLYIGLHYTLAMFLATLLGVLFNFKSTGALVFGSHNNRLIFRFVGSYAVIYFINIIGIKAFSHIGVVPYIGGAILIFPMAVLSYFLNKRFVFSYG